MWLHCPNFMSQCMYDITLQCTLTCCNYVITLYWYSVMVWRDCTDILSLCMHDITLCCNVVITLTDIISWCMYDITLCCNAVITLYWYSVMVWIHCIDTQSYDYTVLIFCHDVITLCWYSIMVRLHPLLFCHGACMA